MGIYRKLFGGLGLFIKGRFSSGAAGGISLPAVSARVEENTSTATTRVVNDTTRYANSIQGGTPRQMLPKYGITLNGSTEYATGPKFDPSLLSQMSVPAWFKTSASGATQEIAGQWGYVTDSAWLLGLNSSGNALAYVCSDGSGSTNYRGIVSSGTYNDGVWHHAALVLDGATLKLYVDGVDQGAVTDSNGTFTGMYAATDPIRIGVNTKTSNLRHFAGQLDDIRILDTALSATEIAALAAMKPGSQSGATTSTPPLIHYKCEESVTSTTLRNSGTLGSVSDATITTAAIATVRGTASPVYSFANSVGGSQAYVTDGVNDYLDTQLTLNGATAFTVWRRMRYLSNTTYGLDGFRNAGGSAVRLGRYVLTRTQYYNFGDDVASLGDLRIIADGEVHTMAISASVGGTEKSWINGVPDVNTAASMTAISNAELYTIGMSDGGTSFPANAEYYEYLIADRVLTDDELTWLETGGQAGTAIDFAGDANILLYTDFSDQTATTIRNHANANLPILKAVGGELTMVPRSESDTTKDVDQAAYAYRSAVYLPGSANYLDFGSVLIGATDDFDISFDFMCHELATELMFSQYTGGGPNRMYIATYVDGKVELYVQNTPVVQVASATGLVTAGRWYTVRATRAGDVFTLYLDGVQVGTQTQSGVSVEQTNSHIATSEATLDDFNGLITNLDINGNQYLTQPGDTITGATLSNASYVDVVRGKPGTIQHTGIAPRDMVLTEPALATDGAADYCSATVASTTSYPVTFTTKFKIDSGYTGVNALVALNNSAFGAYYFRLKVDSGDLIFERRSSALSSVGQNATLQAVAADTWYTATVEVAGDDSFNAWVNGTKYEFTSQPVVPLNTLNADTFIAGQTRVISPASFFDGTLSNCMLSYTAQTDANMAAGTLESPLVHWSFTGNGGDWEPDLSGNGNTGTLVGTVANMRAGTTNVGSGTCVVDGFAAARWYDGANDYWDGPKVLEGSASWSLGCWLAVDDLSANRVFVSQYLTTGSQREWQCYVSTTGQLVCNISGNGTTAGAFYSAAGTIEIGRLYHVAFAVDGANNTARLFVDGVDVTSVVNSIPSALFDGTASLTIGANTGGVLHHAGVLSHLVIHDGAYWTAANTAAIKAATPDTMPSVVQAIGGTAWYFPYGDGSYEALQSLAALTHNGASEQRVIPVGPNAIIPATHGPGVLPPGHSLDLYCDEANSPYAIAISDHLVDGTYNFGDGSEGNILFVSGDDNHETLVLLEDATDNPEFFD